MHGLHTLSMKMATGQTVILVGVRDWRNRTGTIGEGTSLSGSFTR